MCKEAQKNLTPTLTLVAVAGLAVAAAFIAKRLKTRHALPTADSLMKMCSASAEALERRVISMAG